MEKAAAFMHIFVKLPSKTITLDVLDNFTVAVVKFKIIEKERIPFNQQRLKLADHQLKDSCTLSDYNIKKDVHVIF